MPHCYVEKLVSFLSRKLVSGFFTNRRTVEMGESVWESFFPYFQEEKSGKSRLVKLEGYDNFNTWKLYYFVCQFCWIEVPVVSIQSYTCPTISHPEPNYPYDFTVDQVVQQLSLVETMLRKKKYVRWCVWKKKVFIHNIMMSCHQMWIQYLSWHVVIIVFVFQRLIRVQVCRCLWNAGPKFHQTWVKWSSLLLKGNFWIVHETKISFSFGGVFSSIGRSSRSQILWARCFFVDVCWEGQGLFQNRFMPSDDPVANRPWWKRGPELPLRLNVWGFKDWNALRCSESRWRNSNKVA